MNKLVTRINWVNDTDPAINDTHLNQMDSELDAIDDRVISMETDVIEQAENAEAWANGTRGGEAIGPSDPAYHKDAKYQAGEAASSASAAATSETNAGNSATAAGNSALVSEGFAKGTQNGQAVGPGSPYYHNNAEYFKDQAQAAASGQVQADWDENDTTSKAYIRNKPTIPSTASDIGAGTFTGKVQANGTAMATLSDAQLRDATISDTDLTAGTSVLATGTIYFYYT